MFSFNVPTKCIILQLLYSSMFWHDNTNTRFKTNYSKLDYICKFHSLQFIWRQMPVSVCINM